MEIYSRIFSALFIILGSFIWIVAVLIILVGSLGVLRITVKETFEIDLLEKIFKKDKE